MKFSIITVVFNASKTIERAIKSVITQKNIEIEYIVIDGESTDGTLEIIHSYRDCIDSLISEPDAGIYDAMNKGITLATGDVIGFLNADDYFPSDDILKYVSQAFDGEKIDIAFGDVAYFRSENLDKNIRLYRSNTFSPEKIKYGIIPAHPASYIRKKLFDQYGLFDIQFKIAGDFEFFARIFKSETISYAYLPMILVRMQLGGMSRKGISALLMINREIKIACVMNDIHTNQFLLILRYFKKSFEYIFLAKN